MRPVDGGHRARASRDAQDSTLSAHRAVGVHLASGGGPGRRRLVGRVEHLSSGESIRFTSLKELLAFFACTLAARPSPRGPGRYQCGLPAEPP